MSNLVPSTEIERIVGADRHPTEHLGRAVARRRMVYILHSAACRDSGIDLRQCEFSLALDRGIDRQAWRGNEGHPVRLVLDAGRLLPSEGSS